MSVSNERMLKLMAYADGELEGAELEEVQAWLAEDPNAVRVVNELANLGELVTLGHEGSSAAKAIATFDIADAVLSRLHEEPKREHASPAAVSLDAARARRQRNLRMGGLVAAALALAASVFLVTRNKEEQPMAVTVQPAATVAGGPGVEVDVVETPEQSVSVFYLPSESSLTTTSVVVWVDETGGK
jgi:anti-sigma factor RsiW